MGPVDNGQLVMSIKLLLLHSVTPLGCSTRLQNGVRLLCLRLPLHPGGRKAGGASGAGGAAGQRDPSDMVSQVRDVEGELPADGVPLVQHVGHGHCQPSLLLS